MNLCDLLDAKRDEITRRFVERARAAGAAQAMPDEDVMDNVREFMTELCEHMRHEARSGVEALQPLRPAMNHGHQRFALGCDAGALVREYAALRELLWDIVVEARVEVPTSEWRLLFKYLMSGLADAAVQYGASRDAELERRTAEHVSFLAHELRNPLGSAALALRLLEEERDAPAHGAAIASLGRALSRMGQLVDDALVGVRLRELGRVDRVPIDMKALIEELGRESALDAAAKAITLIIDGDGRVDGDPRALRSAISNLVRNAVKFTPRGGDVHVRARRSHGRVFVEVEDSCGGLPEGNVQKVFDPFVQVGLDRSGFGLGLAIAKQAVAAHDGEIRVHDIPGKGCVFVLDLPESTAAIS